MTGSVLGRCVVCTFTQATLHWLGLITYLVLSKLEVFTSLVWDCDPPWFTLTYPFNHALQPIAIHKLDQKVRDTSFSWLPHVPLIVLLFINVRPFPFGHALGEDWWGKIDAIPEAVTDGVEGFLVPPSSSALVGDWIFLMQLVMRGTCFLDVSDMCLFFWGGACDDVFFPPLIYLIFDFIYYCLRWGNIYTHVKLVYGVLVLFCPALKELAVANEKYGKNPWLWCRWRNFCTTCLFTLQCPHQPRHGPGVLWLLWGIIYPRCFLLLKILYSEGIYVHKLSQTVSSTKYLRPWAWLRLGDAGAIQEAVLKLYHDPQQLGAGIGGAFSIILDDISILHKFWAMSPMTDILWVCSMYIFLPMINLLPPVFC